MPDTHYTRYEAEVADEAASITMFDEPSTPHEDQKVAASREVEALREPLFEDLGAVLGMESNTAPGTSEHAPWLLARVIVAIQRIDPYLCDHIAEAAGPMPVYASLGLDLLTCEACKGRLLPTPIPDTHDRCDWCCARGVVLFTPHAVTVSHFIVMGDACHHCSQRLLAGGMPR